jgi:hypothetical protein
LYSLSFSRIIRVQLNDQLTHQSKFDLETAVTMSDIKQEGIEDGLRHELSATNDMYDETKYYMSGSKLAILISGLCLALFLLGLDTAIVSTVGNLYANTTMLGY